MEPHSGKSIVALGLVETLSTRVERVGFFRPIVASGSENDPQIELIRRRYRLETSYAEMHALSDDEGQAAIASGVFNQVEQRVVASFRELELRSDVVVCEGTDFTGASPALDFDLNAGLAVLLDAPVLVVVSGTATREIVKSARVARESLERKGCALFGVIANRVPPELVDEVTELLRTRFEGQPVYVLPEQPDLAYPTMRDVAAALGAHPVGGMEAELYREVRDVTVAAMSVEHFLRDLTEGTLVIVPGDRPDIIVASLASTVSGELPAVAGIVLTGGYGLDPALRRLVEEAPFPVLEAPGETYPVATAVSAVRPQLAPDDDRRIAAALGLFESRVDARELERQIALERPGAHDAHNVPVRAGRAGTLGSPPHRPAGGRRRTRAARGRDAAAPRGGGPHAAGPRGRGAPPGGGARPGPERGGDRRSLHLTAPRGVRERLPRAAHATRG